ncbi:MAG TPA: SRPBCC family protein [Bryobacteraceae bacterium]|nr:SRPBCC family protein [Bryobacteraceae bacterium]
MSDRYHFITRWRFRAAPADVFAIISDALDYPRWWPSVYLSVRELGPKRVRMLTRGWLPYKLRWDAETIEAKTPERLVIRAKGDFEGTGVWSLAGDGDYTDVTFDWKIRAAKPLIRRLTFLLRPILEANHRWAMEQGRISLKLELARAQATTIAEMNAVPAAPRGVRWRGESAA